VDYSNTYQYINNNNLTFQFVYGTDHQLYLLDEHEHLPLHVRTGHATIFAGRPILMAGEMGFVAASTSDEQKGEEVAPLQSISSSSVSSSTDYRLVWISDSSGHYRPSQRHVRQFYETLRDRHDVNVDAIQWLVRGPPIDFASLSSSLVRKKRT
jgi:hypothetical protein